MSKTPIVFISYVDPALLSENNSKINGLELHNLNIAQCVKYKYKCEEYQQNSC